MMLINIQVEIHEDDAERIREGKMDKKTAIEASINHEHYAIIETLEA